MISEIEVVEGSEEEVSWMEKAVIEPCLIGCAEAWLGVGSIESKLEMSSESGQA